VNPSPAGTNLNEREFFLAGDGSEEERGLRPFSKTSFPFQTNELSWAIEGTV
jgi:hypothetical protein